MTLLRVLDYGDERDEGNIVWSYYPNVDLIAYSVGRRGKGHPQIEIAVEEMVEDIGDTGVTGEIIPPLRKFGARVQVAGYRNNVGNRFYQLLKEILEKESIPIESPPAQVVFTGKDPCNLRDLLGED